MVATFTYLMLPNDITSATFLSEEERDFGMRRLKGAKNGAGNKEKYESDYLSDSSWKTSH